MGPKISLFYLDDEVAQLDLFEQMFADDYDVRTAETARDARHMLAERAADIVISDQRMPDVNGSEFLREVAARYPSSYRILLTGNSKLVEVMQEISSGIIHLFLTKPWTEEHMRQALERASAASEIRSKRARRHPKR
ncbi:MAG TPA: response regulator [Pyrinomonadaceae bacterium]|jgi:DNA-binding NtrC family response regulator